MKTLLRLSLVTLALVLASLGFVFAMGPIGVPSFFIVAATGLLAPTLFLVGRAGLSLVREPPPEEVELATGRRRKELEREKQALLKAIKELGFDHEMGKISDRDHADFVARYRARALDVMRRLDDATVDYRKVIEQELAARLGGAPKPPAPTGEKDEADEPDQATAQPAPPSSSSSPLPPSPPSLGLPERPLCPGCATVNEVDADFCKRCGKALRAPQEASS